MGAKKQSVRARSEETSTGSPALKWILWSALAAAWAFVAASLLSFNPADPPTHVVWPVNEHVSNWSGPVGAAVAFHLLRTLGLGAWALLVSGGIYLVAWAGWRRVSWPLLRVVGIAMLVAAIAGLEGLLWPASGAFPGLAGGLVGATEASELAARFGPFGSALWLVLLGAIGAIVAFDRWLVVVPARAWRILFPPARRAAGMAGATTAGAARAAGSAVEALATMVKGRAPVRIRLDDLEDDEELTEVVPRVARASAGRTGAARPGPARPEPVQASDAAVEDEDADLPGAPQVFDQAALREKVARLPLRFAATDRRIATEDDLRDLQNVQELEGYRFPSLDLLEDPEENFSGRLEQLVREQAQTLESALKEYRIRGEVVGIESGPVITLYHVRLAPGTKVAQLSAVSSDVARLLKAVNIRIVPNMVGRDTVGIEVPNPTKEKVRLKELMGNRESFSKMRLPMFLGKDASGEPLIADLAKMPHMLIAGTTGSGKSVCMNTIIMGFMYSKKPNELKMVLVDPKMVEMSQFKDVPHLMCPVVTEMSRAAAILDWAVTKMDERYELLAEAGVRDIAAYNDLGWEELKERFEPQSEAEEARIPRRLPYMVFIFDELADLMMTNKEVEGSIVRLAQKARAIGIHLILATQRPQANVVTGLIKSNMPCRIAFKVSSGMDSRIVLDQKGGELLLGQGDMLFLSPTSHKLTRAQGTLVDDKETRRVVRFMRDVARPTFERQLVQLRSADPDQQRLYESENNSSASLSAAQEDPLFDRAVEIVLESRRGSVSLLQRRLAIGYTRASRLIDLMGIAGIISEHKGSVARDVLVTPEEWVEIKRLAREQAGADQGTLFGDGPDAGPDLPDKPADEVPGEDLPGEGADESNLDVQNLEEIEEDEDEDESEEDLYEMDEDDEEETEEEAEEEDGLEDAAGDEQIEPEQVESG